MAHIWRRAAISSPIDGTLLYHSDETPLVTAVPTEAKIKHQDTSYYIFRTTCSKSGLQYVKLLPESQAMGMVRSSQSLFLLVTALSMVGVSALIILSVRRTLHPVNNILDLLQQHSGLQDVIDIRQANSVLENVLQQREEQAQTLAQRDAVLSEYFLHSQLKSVYVDRNQRTEPDTGPAYILYIQVYYRDNISQLLSIPRAELESLLQQVFSEELNRHFETTLIFQIEPSRFVAKVTLPKKVTGIEACMAQFMRRLEQERDFSYFTVVQSLPLSPEEDLAGVYTYVLQAARQAKVCKISQLLCLDDLPSDRDFLFSSQEEQQLIALVNTRQADAAADYASEILDMNLLQGISYLQMEILCIAIVNTVIYAISGTLPSTERLAAVNSVYNTITTKCITEEDYKRTLSDFICSCISESDPQDPLLKRVQQYLLENYHREFSGEEMAEALKVSRSYLSSYYKNKTGINLSDSIQLYRIQKAMELMKDPDITISEVGALVGINSGNTFLRQFKKYTGMSPKEYRAKCQCPPKNKLAGDKTS